MEFLEPLLKRLPQEKLSEHFHLAIASNDLALIKLFCDHKVEIDRNAMHRILSAKNQDTIEAVKSGLGKASFLIGLQKHISSLKDSTAEYLKNPATLPYDIREDIYYDNLHELDTGEKLLRELSV